MARMLAGQSAILAALSMVDIDPAVINAAMTPPPSLNFNAPSMKGITDRIERVPYTGMNRQQRRAMERENV